jgi:hypothetical protein
MTSGTTAHGDDTRGIAQIRFKIVANLEVHPEVRYGSKVAAKDPLENNL